MDNAWTERASGKGTPGSKTARSRWGGAHAEGERCWRCKKIPLARAARCSRSGARGVLTYGSGSHRRFDRRNHRSWTTDVGLSDTSPLCAHVPCRQGLRMCARDRVDRGADSRAWFARGCECKARWLFCRWSTRRTNGIGFFCADARVAICRARWIQHRALSPHGHSRASGATGWGAVPAVFADCGRWRVGYARKAGISRSPATLRAGRIFRPCRQTSRTRLTTLPARAWPARHFGARERSESAAFRRLRGARGGKGCRRQRAKLERRTESCHGDQRGMVAWIVSQQLQWRYHRGVRPDIAPRSCPHGEALSWSGARRTTFRQYLHRRCCRDFGPGSCCRRRGIGELEWIGWTMDRESQLFARVDAGTGTAAYRRRRAEHDDRTYLPRGA